MYYHQKDHSVQDEISKAAELSLVSGLGQSQSVCHTMQCLDFIISLNRDFIITLSIPCAILYYYLALLDFF